MKLACLLSGAALLLANPALADPYTTAIAFRALPEIQMVSVEALRIDGGCLDGSQLDQLEKHDLLASDCQRDHSRVWKAQISDQLVELRATLSPPGGHGYKGGIVTGRLTIRVNGTPVITEVPFGDARGGYAVQRINLSPVRNEKGKLALLWTAENDDSECSGYIEFPGQSLGESGLQAQCTRQDR
jgi:hypothetical protein